MRNRKGRRVTLHVLDHGFFRSYRFLDPKTNDFIEAAGTSRKEASAIAAANGLRIERTVREDG